MLSAAGRGATALGKASSAGPRPARRYPAGTRNTGAVQQPCGSAAAAKGARIPPGYPTRALEARQAGIPAPWHGEHQVRCRRPARLPERQFRARPTVTKTGDP